MDTYVNDYLDARLSLFGTPVALSPARQSPGLLARLRAWNRKHRTLRELRALDDHVLADIGLSRDAIRPVVEGLADKVPAV